MRVGDSPARYAPGVADSRALPARAGNGRRSQWKSLRAAAALRFDNSRA